MTDAARQTAHVVIALEAAAHDLSVLEIVRCMTGESLPELLGLLIEDEELLGLARSRLAREVLLSGAARPLDRAALHRQLRARYGVLRKRFESAAAEYGMRSRWQLGRGDVFVELASQAQSAETLAVSMTSHPARPAARLSRGLRDLAGGRARTLLLAREGWRTGRRVLVVVTPGADVERLLAAAVPLARQSASTLGVLLIGAARDGDRPARIAAIAGAEADVPIETMTAAAWSAADTAKTAHRQHARLLLVPWPADDTEADAIADLVAATRCAVLLVR